MVDALKVSMESMLTRKKMMTHLHSLKRAMMMMEGTNPVSGLARWLYDRSTNPFMANKRFKHYYL